MGWKNHLLLSFIIIIIIIIIIIAPSRSYKKIPIFLKA